MTDNNWGSKDGSDDGDGANFDGQKRSNKTHESTTDPDAVVQEELWQGVKLSYLGYTVLT